MIINTLYNKKNKAHFLYTKQSDIVCRTGVTRLKDEISLMEGAGQIYNNYIEKIYGDQINKEENTSLRKNTLQYKETLDIIDEERYLKNEIEYNKRTMENLLAENEKMKEKLIKEQIKNKNNTNTVSNSSASSAIVANSSQP